MRNIFLLSFVTLIICSCTTKTEKSMLKLDTNIQKTELERDSFAFPEDWEGVWIGKLEVHSPKGLHQTIPMELHILPIDSVGYKNSHTFNIIYGEDRVKGLRPYEMRLENAAKGLYITDEKNGIELEKTLINNTFHSFYEVDGVYIINTYERVKDGIKSNIISGKFEVSHTSGEGTEESPKVNDYPIRVVQSGFLRKK